MLVKMSLMPVLKLAVVLVSERVRERERDFYCTCILHIHMKEKWKKNHTTPLLA